MSRRKSISDDLLLDRLLVGIAQTGPADLSFARAARVAGLSAPTLVQRFGSREAMVEAVLLRAWDLLDARTAAADAACGPGALGAVDLLLQLTLGGDAAHDSGDGLLLLREDIRNPVLRARGAAWGETLVQAIARRLPEDGARLGWEAVSLWQGAIIWWSFRRNAPLAEVVASTLEGWRKRNGDLTR
ncbi:MAG: TetR/AcrR family transcriptional regulator [Proteobacteria bacterium]|nr:TetR/AcrR family transcriptional regulator [Pseudomonadota bacterium]